MVRDRIKKGIKAGLKKVLRVDISGPQPDYGVEARHRGGTAAPPVPAPSPPPLVVAPPEVVAAPPEPEPELKPGLAEVEHPVAAEPIDAPAVELAAPSEAQSLDPGEDTVGAPFTLEAVQEILDDMVRPALQGDGGDISLIRIEQNDIYVKLVGSCSSCPSSIMTMKMGVESLLKEEFPAMGQLIQVD